MENQDGRPSRRRSAASELITSGPVWSAVWHLAWPTAVNTLIMTAYNVINGVFVGRLPNAEQALAAIGIGFAALMIQFALTIGIGAGTSALVSRFIGAEQYENADEATGQSLVLSVICAILSGVPIVVLARPIVAAIGAQGPVIPLAAGYAAIIAWFSIPGFIYFIAQAALRSTGDVKSPLYAGAATICLNVLLDWLLIFGIGPFPMLGVRGAAVATGTSRVVGMVVSLWFLRRSILRPSFRRLWPHWGWFARILNVGWPATLQNLIFAGANVVFLRILALMGTSQATAAQAALTVGMRIESVAFMPGLAYMTAAVPLVGQNLGAENPDRAEHCAWVATGQAVAIMATVGVAFFVVPRWLTTLFTSDAAVVPLAVLYLQINAVSEPFIALGLVLRGALQGAGETRAPAWISFVTLWVIRLPLAWALTVGLGYGAVGAWIAMSGTTILSGLMILRWFTWGNWRTVRV